MVQQGTASCDLKWSKFWLQLLQVTVINVLLVQPQAIVLFCHQMLSAGRAESNM